MIVVDAVYVATAHTLHLPLLTWDDDQRARAGRVIAAFTPDTRDPRIVLRRADPGSITSISASPLLAR